MGIVAKQSIQNILSIAAGVLLGAVNTLFLYPVFLGSQLQGLVVALLAVSNLLQPFISVGLQHALIRFFPRYSTKEEQHVLLSWSLLVPVIFITVFALLYVGFGDRLLAQLFGLNLQMQKYGYIIFAIAAANGFFEVFYSWLRVELHSVFGNFLKEFYPRSMICIFLVLYGFANIDFDFFLNGLLVGYYLRLAIIAAYGFWLHRPHFRLQKLAHAKDIINYSFIILLAGTASSLLLDIDKSMLPALITVEFVAYYSVALFMASVVELPGRAMFQIISPLVAKALHNKELEKLQHLLRQSSILLMWGSGYIFLIIALNASDFYDWIGQPKYKQALEVVYWVGAAKLTSMALGCLNQIISNSEWYRYSLFFSVGSALAAIVLNYYAIQIWGMLGAAYATFTVIICINLMKYLLIVKKMQLTPFGKENLKIVFIILLVAVAVSQTYNGPLGPFWDIVLRSLIISLAYVGLSIGGRLHTHILPFVNEWRKPRQ